MNPTHSSMNPSIHLWTFPSLHPYPVFPHLVSITLKCVTMPSWFKHLFMFWLSQDEEEEEEEEQEHGEEEEPRSKGAARNSSEFSSSVEVMALCVHEELLKSEGIDQLPPHYPQIPGDVGLRCKRAINHIAQVSVGDYHRREPFSSFIIYSFNTRWPIYLTLPSIP